MVKDQVGIYKILMSCKQAAKVDRPDLPAVWNYVYEMSKAIMDEMNQERKKKFKNKVTEIGPIFKQCRCGEEMKLTFQPFLKEREYQRQFSCYCCGKTYMCSDGFLRCESCFFKVCKECTNKQPDALSRAHHHPLKMVF